MKVLFGPLDKLPERNTGPSHLNYMDDIERRINNKYHDTYTQQRFIHLFSPRLTVATLVIQV
jgi:hypothetical protein